MANPIVLILGGWSPGLLLYLQEFLSSQRYQTVQLRNLSMPPIPGPWCWDPNVMGMLGILIAVLWLLHSFSFGPHWVFASIVVTLIWYRLFAAAVVRASINKSIKIAQHALRENEGREVIIVGFSWGAAVVAEMLARGMIGGIDQPSALLIAPTTSIVASIAMEKDPAQRILHPISEECVQVVHGTADEVFCPHQERWNETDVSLHRLYDNHVFLLLASKRQLIEILSCLLRSAHTRA